MLLDSISLKDVLSFHEATLELQPLNVLIGPNASGKSNLISAISLLKAAPGDLQEAIRRGGGVRQWICKRPARMIAGIQARIEVPDDARPVQYSLEFTELDSGFHIVSESLRPVVDNPGSGFLERSPGHMKIYRTRDQPSEADIAESKSGLAAYRDPADPTPITRVGEALGAIQIFREFHTDLNSPVRIGVSTMAYKDFLWEGGGNLALILDDLRFAGKLEPLKEYLRRFWEEADDVRVKTDGPVTQTYVKERGIEEPISAIRLSDGTLKFLCLLAALLQSDPPPLICIEEPEAGLHPDAMSIVADVLREASRECQVIVTTHSAELVSALSDHPEAVVVCERGEDGGTGFRRLRSSDLDEWLERYRLGELWRKGEIGGNRW